ncbi:MAG: lysophospholipid acyltransferase family protein, partial [Candidatus Hydrogenedentes bacterium]|nr:lysophospholipid acyltransferase family protein [Candidatus Hydrogenedentota bacterium]
AAVAYHVVPRIKRVGFSNLDLAYGDALSKKEKTRILKASVRNVGIVAAEFSRIPLLAQDEFFDRWVRLEGTEHIKSPGRALLISAHLGNWEWLTGALSRLGYKTAEVVRPLRDPRLNTYIDTVRQSNGGRTIEKAQAGAEILKLLRDDWCVGILVDQNPHESAVPVKFFGVDTWATAAPAMLAARAKVPVHPLSMVRQPDGTYVLRIYPPLDLVTEGGLRANLLGNSQQCQDAIEALVREYPEQWLWIHRRWKPRPRFEEEWARKQAQAKEEAQS